MIWIRTACLLVPVHLIKNLKNEWVSFISNEQNPFHMFSPLTFKKTNPNGVRAHPTNLIMLSPNTPFSYVF